MTTTIPLEAVDTGRARPRKPEWLKIRAGGGPRYAGVKHAVEERGLHTVCQEARCPNIGECWGHGTATFMILGDICTRGCRYCAVDKGMPTELDLDEPAKLADAVVEMGLSYVVVTSVDRDDLADGGASIFAGTIRAIRDRSPATEVEVLIPDFRGNPDALRAVLDAGPDVLNHNVETVPRLFKRVQPQDRYEWAAATLSNAKKLDPDVLTKSGIMVGLGETMEEIKAVMRDQREWGVDILTVGQYLQPSKKHLPIERYYTPEEFEEIKTYGEEIGFRWVESGPLVRSSYHAAEQVRALSAVHRALYG